jgi:5'(3')-deoxyribonucleotidase
MLTDVLLDMDGVISNFNHEIVKLFGLDPTKVIDTWEVHETIGCPKEEVYKRMAEAGHDMWASMKPYERAKELIDVCKKYGELTICTAPTMDPYCASGKTEWLQKFFGKYFRDYAITPKKEKLANPFTVLIDDHDKNIKKFHDRGGKVILFPQIWNSGRTYEGDKVEFVEHMLQRYAA